MTLNTILAGICLEIRSPIVGWCLSWGHAPTSHLMCFLKRQKYLWGFP
jgi:hypothetical protein